MKDFRQMVQGLLMTMGMLALVDTDQINMKFLHLDKFCWC